jgi:hypothetical protein
LHIMIGAAKTLEQNSVSTISFFMVRLS